MCCRAGDRKAQWATFDKKKLSIGESSDFWNKYKLDIGLAEELGEQALCCQQVLCGASVPLVLLGCLQALRVFDLQLSFAPMVYEFTYEVASCGYCEIAYLLTQASTCR